MNTIIKRLSAASGDDPEAYSRHSLRAGFVTEAAARGHSLAAIMQHTRHKSPAVALTYYRAGRGMQDSLSLT